MVYVEWLPRAAYLADLALYVVVFAWGYTCGMPLRNKGINKSSMV
jgi:hypothetical protein